MIEISGSLIWSKTLMELIFNSCGEFWWSPEGPVSQIHSPYLYVVPLGSFQICSDATERVRCGKQREVTSPIQSLVKLQPWCLLFTVKALPLAEHTDDDYLYFPFTYVDFFISGNCLFSKDIAYLHGSKFTGLRHSHQCCVMLLALPNLLTVRREQ